MDAPPGDDLDSDAVPKSSLGRHPRTRRLILAAVGGTVAVVIAVVAVVA